MTENPIADLHRFLFDLDAAANGENGRKSFSQALTAMVPKPAKTDENGSTGENAPAGNDAKGPTMWDVHARASRAYANSREILIAAGKLAENEVFINWARDILYRPNDSWGTPLPVIDPAYLQALKVISDATWVHLLLPPALTTEQIEALKEALEETREALGRIPTIPNELRHNISRLLDASLELLVGDDVDLYTLRSLTEELSGALITPALLNIPQEDRKTVFQRVARIAATWVLSATAGAAGTLLAAEIMPLIEGVSVVETTPVDPVPAVQTGLPAADSSAQSGSGSID